MHCHHVCRVVARSPLFAPLPRFSCALSHSSEVDLLDLLLPHLDASHINERVGEEGFTALHVCADMGALRTARRLLIDGRADLSVPDKKGRTACAIAEAQGNSALANCLQSTEH